MTNDMNLYAMSHQAPFLRENAAMRSSEGVYEASGNQQKYSFMIIDNWRGSEQAGSADTLIWRRAELRR